MAQGNRGVVGLRFFVACGDRRGVSDHRGSNSQVVDFERLEIFPIFMVKIENSEKSNT